MTNLYGNIRTFFFFKSFQVLKHPDKKFQVGQAIEATVVDPDVPRAFLCLSLIGVERRGTWSERGWGGRLQLPPGLETFSVRKPGQSVLGDSVFVWFWFALGLCSLACVTLSLS